MNIRSLTRGDGVVIGAALLLFIASFLKFYGVDCPSGVSDAQCDAAQEDMPAGWSGKLFATGAAIFLAGLVSAILIVVGRALPEGRKPAGLTLDQVGTGFAISSLISTLFALVNSPEGEGVGPALGAYLALLATLALVAGAVMSTAVPAFKAPLLPAPRPQQPQQPYGGQQPGYGYPGQQGQQPPYGQQQPSYGQSPSQPQPQPQQQTPMPNQAGPGAGGAAFAPFWFAVPAQRPLYAEDGSPSRIADLTPGTWYLAVEQRGNGLIAQTQDGRRGLLQDTNGIQRG